jgi:hypothetical protein
LGKSPTAMRYRVADGRLELGAGTINPLKIISLH